MGITIKCKKTHRSIDMGYGGFNRLRNKVADLVGEPWASHYHKLDYAPIFGDSREHFFEAYNAETQLLLEEKKVSIKVVDFCLQPDCEGSIRYGACKELLKAIGDYDDDILYGYCGMQAHACLTEEEEIVLKDWAHGRSIASTAMTHHMSPSKVDKIRAKLRYKYDGIQSYLDLPTRRR